MCLRLHRGKALDAYLAELNATEIGGYGRRTTTYLVPDRLNVKHVVALDQREKGNRRVRKTRGTLGGG